jgi:hypothetical protein
MDRSTIEKGNGTLILVTVRRKEIVAFCYSDGVYKSVGVIFMCIFMKMSSPEKIRDHFVTIWNYGK